MHLPFLLPNESSSGDYYFCPWYEASTMEHCLVIFGAGSVGGCLFLAYRPDEEGLLVLI